MIYKHTALLSSTSKAQITQLTFYRTNSQTFNDTDVTEFFLNNIIDNKIPKAITFLESLKVTRDDKSLLVVQSFQGSQKQQMVKKTKLDTQEKVKNKLPTNDF